MENNDNNQNNQTTTNFQKPEEIFASSPETNSGFKKVDVNTTKNAPKKQKSKTNSYYSGKPKFSFGKSVVVPFVSGVVGAVALLAVCINVPAISENLFTSTVSSDGTVTTSINYNSGAVSTAVSIEDYSNTAIEVASKVLPSVVSIEIEYTVSTTQSFYGYGYGGGTSTSTAIASGSGVIITSDGYILTNNHVVNEDSSDSYYQVSTANKISVYLYNDETEYEATIVGTDEVTDLAVLKIEASNLTAATLGDSDSVQVGEFVMAVGNPLEMSNTVTAGIVSALNREITDDDGTEYNLIQTDAAINSGNSGGALVNADGEVIGINTLKLSGESIEGIGFAIPINDTTEIIEQLIAYGNVKRPYIGISGSDVTEEYASYYNIPQGVYVNSIIENSPAEKAGLQVGDVITKFNDTTITSMTELTKAKNACEIGDTVSITVYRSSSGDTKTLTLTLEEDTD